MLEPKSPDAVLIRDLYNLIFVLSIFVFVIVEGLLIYSAVKFRRKRADEMPEQIHGNTNMELLWTILPAILVAFIFVVSANTMQSMAASGTLTDPINHSHALNDLAAAKRVQDSEPVDMVVSVTARQWFWQYSYNDGEVVIDSNSSELIIPEHKSIRLDMTSNDVIHAWWIPQFGPMRYVNPGERSYVWFDVPAGDYIGQCNVFCGLAHAQMLARVKVLSQADFDAWYTSKTGAANAPVEAGNADRGKKIVLETGPCKTCHYIEGTAAQGRVAPRELTHFQTYPTIGQVPGLTNNPENLAKWLANPQALKPGTAMPNNGLNKQQIADLVAYLQTLK